MRNIIEIVIAIAAFIAVTKLWPYAYAGPAAIITTVIVTTIILAMRGESWRAVGLRFPNSVPGFFLGLGIVVLVIASVAVIANVAPPYLEQYFGAPTVNSLSNIETLTEYLTIMAIAWTTAAIGEELLFRGFLMNWIAGVFNSSVIGWGLAAIIQAVIFGLAHGASQGLYGIAITGTIGLIFGLAYMIGRRNLLPLIIAHGLVDTISLSQTYFGAS